MTDRRDYHEKRAFKERELSLMSSDPIARSRHAELAALHEAAALGCDPTAAGVQPPLG